MDLANDEPPTIVALQCVQYTEDKTVRNKRQYSLFR
jgi:hypothetical protein